ncbi:MAG: expansin EXLX1 family cellulose-binding protein [Oscillospiraceae bacterium]|nr:expansin EXLX1 family cellulose-binding protein [Oscillospiraceae bacterium]
MIKKAAAAVISAAAALNCIGFDVHSSDAIPFDVNSDGIVNSLDLADARKSFCTGDLKKLRDFVLGIGGGTERGYDSDYTINEELILEPKGTIHTGEGTFYGGGYEGGCAMLDPVSRDYWIVAMNLADYNNAQLAGAYIEVTGELGTINMLVTDLLPEGKKGDLDLYVDAFPLIAPAEKGRVPVSWRIIPLDTAENAPVCYKYKEGTTEFWCGVQVRNHRYPITRLEYLNSDGEFIELERRSYNYFESMEMGAGPFTFRITDIYGQVIVDEGIPLEYDDTVIVPGHVQFPE